MSNYLCVKALRDVRYTDYQLCGDGCCDVPTDESYDFTEGDEYEFDDDLAYRTGRCGRVFVEEGELKEHFTLLP